MRSTGSRAVAAIAALGALAAIAIGAYVIASDGDGGSATRRGPVIPSSYMAAACDLPPQWVKRISRGWVPGGARDLDLVIVPHPPNYMGTRYDTSHSGPYGFLQDVPLVFYGPGFIAPAGSVSASREVTTVDIVPTQAELMGFDLPGSRGAPLGEVLAPTRRTPKLVVTAVIDGGGWNVLERWPDAWPNLARLMEEGASIERATVGSSPSITPAVHTNLSTGVFPRVHEVTAITVRDDAGRLSDVFSVPGRPPGVATMDPRATLAVTTLADVWDLRTGNEALVGMVAPGTLQLGMVGHGSALEGADRDIVAVLNKREEWATNDRFYTLPGYVNTDVEGPEADLEAVDRLDGAADGRWHGHGIRPVDATPAFAPWENRVMESLIVNEGFGRDEITDLLYVNYKAPDAAGHLWNMIAPEQEDTLRSVDDALGDLVDFLDDRVGPNDYVLVITADHGQTPLQAGGWAISRSEISDDMNARFDHVDNGTRLLEQTSASSFFLDRTELAANDVSPEDVAAWMSRYTIGDNVQADDDLPEEFQDRTSEPIFRAVFPGRKLPKIEDCTRRKRS